MARATRHGEIVWASLDKRRPVVVISRDDKDGMRQRVTVATVTSKIREIPAEVFLDQSDGLRGPSVVNCDEIATINKARLGERVGQLSSSQLADLHRSLAFSLALPS